MRERGADGVLEPVQAVAAGDQDVADAAVAQVGGHAGPEPGPFPGGRGIQRRFGQPDAQHVLFPVGVDAGREVGGLALHDVVVADLDHDRVQEDDGVNRIERPALPGPDLLQHGIGDAGDGLVRELGAIHLLKVMQDVADAHPVRIKADDHVVQAAGNPPGPLGHQPRLEVPRPVPGHLDWHRPDPGLHLLADRAIPRIPGIMAGRVMPRIAQVPGQLRLQRPLQHRLDQLTQHGPLTCQPQPPGLVPGALQQRIQQPVIDQLTQRRQPLRG